MTIPHEWFTGLSDGEFVPFLGEVVVADGKYCVVIGYAWEVDYDPVSWIKDVGEWYIIGDVFEVEFDDGSRDVFDLVDLDPA